MIIHYEKYNYYYSALDNTSPNRIFLMQITYHGVMSI